MHDFYGFFSALWFQLPQVSSNYKSSKARIFHKRNFMEASADEILSTK